MKWLILFTLLLCVSCSHWGSINLKVFNPAEKKPVVLMTFNEANEATSFYEAFGYTYGYDNHRHPAINVADYCEKVAQMLQDDMNKNDLKCYKFWCERGE
jgi:hypothetical protein